MLKALYKSFRAREYIHMILNQYSTDDLLITEKTQACMLTMEVSSYQFN